MGEDGTGRRRGDHCQVCGRSPGAHPSLDGLQVCVEHSHVNEEAVAAGARRPALYDVYGDQLPDDPEWTLYLASRWADEGWRRAYLTLALS